MYFVNQIPSEVTVDEIFGDEDEEVPPFSQNFLIKSCKCLNYLRFYNKVGIE